MQVTLADMRRPRRRCRFMKGTPRQVIAACFSLCTFTVAVGAGLLAANEATTILIRAVLALLAAYPVGFIVGSICERATRVPPDRRAEAAPHGGEPNVDNEEILTV
jgi:hypothetical protein